MKKVSMNEEEKVALFEQVLKMEKESRDEELFDKSENTQVYGAFRSGMQEVLNMLGICYEYFDWREKSFAVAERGM